MTERRHLLVLGSQCERMAPLTRLERAAAELHDALIAPGMGACEPGLPDGRSIHVGTLALEEVRAEVRLAIEYAEKEGATLVLALLGHGFVPGNTNDLHILVGGSREGDTLSSVSVSAIFGDAVDRLGLNGVIGLVDTCSAAGAIPELSRLLWLGTGTGSCIQHEPVVPSSAQRRNLRHCRIPVRAACSTRATRRLLWAAWRNPGVW